MDVAIACLCARTGQRVSLHAPSTDLSSQTFCHCDTCCWSSGMLCTSYIALDAAPSNFDNLVQYKVPESSSTRWFCRTCGAHVFIDISDVKTGSRKFLVAAGVVEAGRFQTERTTQLGIGSTVDGGLSLLFRETAECYGTGCFAGEEGVGLDAQNALEPAPVNSPGGDTTQKQRRLNGRCLCGGVSYMITPPDETSKSASSPWPDLLVPYHTNSSANPDDVKWWLRANDTKYLAGLCACNSCRLAAGFPIQSWAFVPKSNIFNQDGSPLTYGTGTMKQYESSPGVYRELCSVCGATVFWHCKERPGVVDVSVGLLRSSSGSRAEDWLDWASGRVSFGEEAADQGLIQILSQKSVKIG
ncbi:hypothetical protein AJ80_03291 [Polytolypa hystricis UAMH7299]|uniref:CENP-V/GFA domain-containing protein n=1 Tax=Polytolypa hystricis (strain UAMH7299) TaxID=1447883 RepID=A0A2B7YBE0_POLH7|nr:hypothetical protein AJ80_03291 [Polytolypa hystricis UAMH7299]